MMERFDTKISVLYDQRRYHPLLNACTKLQRVKDGTLLCVINYSLPIDRWLAMLVSVHILVSNPETAKPLFSTVVNRCSRLQGLMHT